MAIQALPTDVSKTLQYDRLHRDSASFRLLQLLAKRSENGYLQCEMLNSSTLIMEGRYTCLSYVWNVDGGFSTGTLKSIILVNDKEVYIHRNLFDFLQVAQRKYVGEPLWIDALCIDQKNVDERNHQVSHMGDIYLRAKRVVAWLGPWEDSATNPISSLQSRIFTPVGPESKSRIPTPVGPESKSLWSLTNPWKRAPKCSALSTSTPASSFNTESSELSRERTSAHLEWGPRSRFLYAARRYWLRAWITQELAVAHRVLLLFGQEELDLNAVGEDVLLDALRNEFALSGDATNQPLYQIWRLATDMQWTTQRKTHPEIDAVASTPDAPNLLTLLTDFQSKQCFYARDRIYSLRYLCKEGPSLEIDYTSSEIALLRHVVQISQRRLCLCSALALSKGLSTGISKPYHRVNPLTTLFLELHHECESMLPAFAPTPCCKACGFNFGNEWGEYVCLRRVCPGSGGHLRVRLHSDLECSVGYWGTVSMGDATLGTSSALVVQSIRRGGKKSIVIHLSVTDLQHVSTMMEHDQRTLAGEECSHACEVRFVETFAGVKRYI